MSLIYLERPAAGDPAGLLILHHGRGADERDLLGLADALDPGFIPTVAGWQPDLASRRAVPVFITHGRHDPIMDVAFARRAHELLDSAGLRVEYHESDAAHNIDSAHIPAAARWLSIINDPSRSMAAPVA